MTLILDEPIESYHSNPAISNSKLRDFDARGPRYYWMRHIRREIDRKDTVALRTGRALETYLFEPAAFAEWFVVKPVEFNGRKDVWKDWLTEQERSGKTVIEHKEFEAFEWMKKAIAECSTAQSLIEAATYQPSFRVPWSGLPGLQSRPDFGSVSGCPASDYRPFTLDLKTVRKLSDLTSGRSVANYGYHQQAAIAHIACEQPETVHYLLAAEKEAPQRAMVLELSPTFIHLGESWAHANLERLAEHYAADHWPLTIEDSMVVEPPAWMLRAFDDEHAENDNDDEPDTEAEAMNG